MHFEFKPKSFEMEMESLPDELLQYIVIYYLLDFDDVHNLCQVNKRFYRLYKEIRNNTHLNADYIRTRYTYSESNGSSCYWDNLGRLHGPYRSGAEWGLFRKGKQVGRWIKKEMDEDGTVTTVCNYVNGKRDGLYLMYDELGRTLFRAVYDQGRLMECISSYNSRL